MVGGARVGRLRRAGAPSDSHGEQRGDREYRRMRVDLHVCGCARTPISRSGDAWQLYRPPLAGAPRPAYGRLMTLAEDRDAVERGFCFEDIRTGIIASGFGEVGDGRSFSFHVERQLLVVEVYRPRLAWTGTRRAEDVVATASRSLLDIDLTDERSLTAAVRDAVADAQPVPRPAR